MYKIKIYTWLAETVGYDAKCDRVELANDFKFETGKDATWPIDGEPINGLKIWRWRSLSTVVLSYQKQDYLQE